jgi:hypothetical protein
VERHPIYHQTSSKDMQVSLKEEQCIIIYMT